MLKSILSVILIACNFVPQVYSLARPDVEFKIFQFPPHMIPRIDGDTSDWDIVPDEYAVGMDQLKDMINDFKIDKNDFDISVKVGWVKGMNHLYFLVEAYDDYWNFEDPRFHQLNQDMFEVIVDADLSGEPIIKCHDILYLETDGVYKVKQKPENAVPSLNELHYSMHGVHAQNYHIFTPPGRGKRWAMVWGSSNWSKELPWANSVCLYDFKHGESGNLVLEFWITPFDYAPFDCPEKAVISKLEENKIIGLTWGVNEYDDLEGKDRKKFLFDGQFNLSQKIWWFVEGTDLCAFRLMPLEQRFLPDIKAHAEFKIIDMERRIVAFKDLSIGKITKWTWDFGNDDVSHEQHPVHTFDSPGGKPVLLTVEGPAGTSQFPFIHQEILLK